MLVIDRSQSMKGKPLADALAAARSFVAARRPGDSIGVVIFGSRAIRLARLSTSGIDADLALRSVAIDDQPGTALYDAIGTASRMLGAEASRARVIVLLTDGSNQSGTTSLNAALAAARRTGVAVHSIGIAGTQFEPGPLQQLARGTGGSYRATRFTADLQVALRSSRRRARPHVAARVRDRCAARRHDRARARGSAVTAPRSPPWRSRASR